jgi:hypothetical protein
MILQNAFMKCINYNKSGEIFNVASGNATSVNTICDLLGGKKIFIQKSYKKKPYRIKQHTPFILD